MYNSLTWCICPDMTAGKYISPYIIFRSGLYNDRAMLNWKHKCKMNETVLQHHICCLCTKGKFGGIKKSPGPKQSFLGWEAICILKSVQQFWQYNVPQIAQLRKKDQTDKQLNINLRKYICITRRGTACRIFQWNHPVLRPWTSF